MRTETYSLGDGVEVTIRWSTAQKVSGDEYYRLAEWLGICKVKILATLESRSDFIDPGPIPAILTPTENEHPEVLSATDEAFLSAMAKRDRERFISNRWATEEESAKFESAPEPAKRLEPEIPIVYKVEEDYPF